MFPYFGQAHATVETVQYDERRYSMNKNIVFPEYVLVVMARVDTLECVEKE